MRLTGWKTPWVTVLSIVERTLPSRRRSMSFSGCSMTMLRSRQLIQRDNTFCCTPAFDTVKNIDNDISHTNHVHNSLAIAFCLLQNVDTILMPCTNNLSTVKECRHYFSTALPSELLWKRAENFAQAECQLWLTVVHYCAYRYLFYFIQLVIFVPFWRYHFRWNKDCQKCKMFGISTL